LTEEQLAAACAEALWQEDRASQELGMAIERIAPGVAVLAMEVNARMVNGHGSCHGGIIFALADSAFAFACNSRNQRMVASDCTITYLQPARLGERLVATAEERARVGRSGVYAVSVRRADGGVVAEFRGHARSLGQSFFPAGDADV
jgi:acyl-CoA thioesterase